MNICRCNARTTVTFAPARRRTDFRSSYRNEQLRADVEAHWAEPVTLRDRMVTQHGYSSYTVAPTYGVSCGQIEERRGWT